MTFSLDIENIFGVKLAADSVLSPTGCIRKWTREIDAALSGTGTQASLRAFHGEGATDLHGADLVISNFLDEETLQKAQSADPVVDDERVVLVTGANGFLGRHVYLQWMEHLAPWAGRLFASFVPGDRSGS